ncbi:hypothetical protein L195_g015682 [Trifolium pratense]|uniref:VOC domain-containing protein n=1 Tax=Trifolium pratense TaxID=57577 RepID=A0A2K3MP09_TRIPR|nr:uncharacterized protein LOC123910586 [Trifolium pratense]PNX92543.1 hypothetical protein L195_g015682 [Trifolium pratense]
MAAHSLTYMAESGDGQNAGGSGIFPPSTLHIQESKVHTAMSFYASVFDAIDLGQTHDPRGVLARKFTLLNGAKSIYIVAVEEDADSSCITYGTTAAGSQVHLAGNPHGMMVAATDGIRGIAEKAEQNGGKVKFGKVLKSAEEKVYTVLTDPIGFLWCINPQ